MSKKIISFKEFTESRLIQTEGRLGAAIGGVIVGALLGPLGAAAGAALGAIKVGQAAKRGLSAAGKKVTQLGKNLVIKARQNLNQKNLQ